MNNPQPTNLPLDGYSVLDFTVARAGPSAVRLLSDWGANVIRIEAPPKHDPGSVTGRRRAPDEQNLHRNKVSLCLNLKSDQGRLVLRRLILKTDIVVENFRASVKERLGLTYEQLKAVKPDIILASISGFGQTGPYSARPGVDQIMQGMSGLMSVTGQPGGPPTRVGIAISDTTSGLFLGQGILLALLHRAKTGQGQWVHTSLLEAMLNKLDFQAARYTVNGEVAEKAGNFHPTLAPMGTFDASNGFINIAASTDRMWANFCQALGAESLKNNPDYANRASRFRNRHQLNAEINALTATFLMDELVTRLNDVGVPCGPINTIGEAFEDPQTKYLRMTRPAHHRELGELPLLRSPINLSASPHPERFHHAAPDPGEQTDQVLTELGYGNDEIQQMRNGGIVA
ncbi:CaiB/BaiF CoA-transferase family protein [Pusillimonas sp. ANT_WB101]|uniref:CaiB/BaiF CoA transferase family protein n=1 Tax=Pusillimonas sp. ANT_WB101 TaxID=2597356 RepID=UPI002105932F|nr:CoA transferase [Pusillimonas sp. ANT_WB101]